MKVKVNKKIITIALSALVLALVSSVTYAYFMANISGNEAAKYVDVQNGTMQLEYDGTNELSLTDAYPGASESVTFTVTNTGTLPTMYQIDLIDVTNTFVVNEELVYEITSTNEGGSLSQTVVPSVNGTIIKDIEIDSGVTQTYTITIKFIETGESQNANQGVTFSGKIQINNLSESNYLSSKILANNNVSLTTLTSSDFKTGEPKGTSFKQTESKNQTFTSTSYTKVYVAKEVEFDDTIGEYVLQDREMVTLSSDYEGYYTCFNQGDKSCATVYKINTIEGTAITNVDKLSRTITSTSTGSGLYKTEDNDGISYYYRGNVNNYVTFAGLTWRIVRINGDGTIRLILNSNATKMAYNSYTTDTYDRKLVGYTYDNSHYCTNTDPCYSEEGTDSEIKEYIDKWYTDNLSSYDDKIALTTFCNDTTHTGSGTATYYFGAYSRINNGTPSLSCLDTSEYYGGVYKLKIGLITADELDYGGMPYYYNRPMATSSNYLYPVNGWYWSLSPIGSSTSNVYMLYAYYGFVYNTITNNGSGAVRPVINLNADTLITSGDGSKTSPYVVE